MSRERKLLKAPLLTKCKRPPPYLPSPESPPPRQVHVLTLLRRARCFLLVEEALRSPELGLKRADQKTCRKLVPSAFPRVTWVQSQLVGGDDAGKHSSCRKRRPFLEVAFAHSLLPHLERGLLP